MKARVRAYSADGSTLLGTLPTIGLRFSVEVGGGGGCAFTALKDDLDTLGAWDSIIAVELELAPNDFWRAAVYALRPPFKRSRVGKQQVDCYAVSLLQAWADETVILPEYTVGDLPRGAGTERAIGWMSSAYDPATDPNEAWDGCYTTSRSVFPTDWPTASGADWISVTGATDTSERKLFRATLTITGGGPQLLRCFFTSDESGTLYVGGEPVIETSSLEMGRKFFEVADLIALPGELAVAVDTATDFTKGGDGVDPIAVAICTVDDNNDPDTWLLVSNDTDWVACRRDDEPPGNEPPGPTPGAMLIALVDEAVARGASGWDAVTVDFSATADSRAAAWPSKVVERFTRYASDSYYAVFQMLAEATETDVWLVPGSDGSLSLYLCAAPQQGSLGTPPSITLDESDIVTMSDERAPTPGTWVAALARDGWVQGQSGTPRREYGLELGTALSRAVADRVVAAGLAEVGRWDGSCRLAPGAPTPLLDFEVGDAITLDYADAPTDVRVLSASATAGEGGLLWDLELVEVPS